MFNRPFIGGGNIPSDVWKKAERLPTAFRDSVGRLAPDFGLPAGQVPALLPNNVIVILDAVALHVAFSHVNAGGMPRKNHHDLRSKGPFSTGQITQIAQREAGLVAPAVVSFPVGLVGATDEEISTFASAQARLYLEDLYKRTHNMKAPADYEHLQGLLDRFMAEHPEYEKNVFIMMRFRMADHFGRIHTAIVHALGKHGLVGHRADDKVYPQDDDLWNNLCTYMMGCKYGIAVFEDFDEREFNPNVPLEYGFMRAWGKRVLLLKEQRLPRMPSDVTGKLYKPFDMMDIEKTVGAQIDQWVGRDLK